MKMKSTAKSSSLGLNASRRPIKIGNMLEKKKTDEARRLTPEQRLLIALELSDAAAVFLRASSKKR